MEASKGPPILKSGIMAVSNACIVIHMIMFVATGKGLEEEN